MRIRLAAGVIALVCAGDLVWWWGQTRTAPRGRRTVISARPLVLTSPAMDAKQLRESMRGANVIIIVMDAARADHVGCYGYPRPTTPNLDELAKESLVFERHYADYPQTKTSTASLLTSLHADTNLVTMTRELTQDSFALLLVLRRAEMNAVYLYSNPWAAPPRSIEGLESIHSRSAKPEALLKAFAGWLTSHAKDRFFAYVHLTPPHYPYDAPKGMAELFTGRPPHYQPGRVPFGGIGAGTGSEPHLRPDSDLMNRYDANLRYAD